MANRHNSTLSPRPIDLVEYFANPLAPRQRQYEAVRAVVCEKRPVAEVAEKFEYQSSTLYSLIRDAKSGRVELFPTVRSGPRGRRTPADLEKTIVALRREGLSTDDIQARLAEDGANVSASTIERILKALGFGKLKRRTNKELGRTTKNTIMPERAEHLDFSKLEPFSVDCPVAGVFFFIPYILESGIIDIVKECQLPESSLIGATQACLSMLTLKLIGSKRLSHIRAYDQEPGLGVFAGLSGLPKPTYICTYSCRYSETMMLDLQERAITLFKKQCPDFYSGEYVNLDFHTIPHFGDEAQMEKVWCGARGKSMKGATTVFAQDADSNAVLYTRADILRAEESLEVKKFIEYWRSVKGDANETLVFDCKFTTYEMLDEISKDNVKFITLRKRYPKLIKETLEFPDKEWNKTYIPIPKRKHKHVSVRESQVVLTKSGQVFRQIAIKDHGRSTPTFIVTNNNELDLATILQVYAKRWRIENKLAELVAFFNLNALSSPIMVRIHFDMFWTMVADTLYHCFAKDLRRFENNLAPTLFRKFIDMPGKVIYDGNRFMIKIRKRAHTPVLMSVEKINTPFCVPWLDGKSVEIVWIA